MKRLPQVRFRLLQIERIVPNFSKESLCSHEGRLPDFQGLLPSSQLSGRLPSGQRLKQQDKTSGDARAELEYEMQLIHFNLKQIQRF